MSLTSEQRSTARTIIRKYLERSEYFKGIIHYSQARPLTSFGDQPSKGFTTDCSGLVISAYYWANLWTKFLVKDPGAYRLPNYSGYGYTGSILQLNASRRIPLDHRFFVGDMCLYGHSLSNTTHVVICRKNGTRKTAIWTSHGSELGPYPVYMDYRPDLLCVVRSESLA